MMIHKKIIKFVYIILEISYLHVNAIRNRNLDIDPNDAILVHPRRVNERGQYLNNNYNYRFKRSFNGDEDETDQTYYEIELGERKIIFDLKPNWHLSSDNIVVERRGKNLSDTKTMFINYDSRCHFQGKIRDNDDSIVAISLCKGMTGLINFNKTTYIIEPLNTQNEGLFMFQNSSYSQSSNDQPHVVYNISKDIKLNRNSLRPDTKRIRKRSGISHEKYIETLLVADKSMVDYYRNDDLETYLLTVMNIVSALYNYTSMDAHVTVALVRLIIFEQENEFEVSNDADKTLDDFCVYQNKINPSASSPYHHDVGVFVTRTDICSKSTCSILGLAHAGTMCQPRKSCSINEDNGMFLAFTIAHEIAHNLNATHDDKQCADKEYIMSRLFSGASKHIIWSDCSKEAMSKYLENKAGCLNNKNRIQLIDKQTINMGLIYDWVHQCRLYFGENSTLCENSEPTCQRIWCVSNRQCSAIPNKAFDGTLCGDSKDFWCQDGSCVPITEPEPPVDGGWSHWSDFSPCSRSCGGGVQTTYRTCDNPPRSNNGRYCLGEFKRYRICNTDACPSSTDYFDFHRYQCEQFNTDKVTWYHYHYNAYPCQLFCEPSNNISNIALLKEYVHDGTPCLVGTNNLCIEGKCRNVGCDWKINSKAVLDMCGVCNGKNDTCIQINGTHTLSNITLLGGYYPFILIPIGARNVKLNENTHNYLAVKDSNDTYYINGDLVVKSHIDIIIQGTQIIYDSIDFLNETLYIKGPTTIELHIMLLYERDPPLIDYEYTLPLNLTSNGRKKNGVVYYWNSTEWSSCSVTCAGGVKTRNISCHAPNGSVVNNKLCSSSLKPETKASCNRNLCDADWWVGQWQACSSSCNVMGVRKRSVLCVKNRTLEDGVTVEMVPQTESNCINKMRPIAVETCYGEDDCDDPRWIVEEWTDTCKNDFCGIETRKVYCSDSNSVCKINNKPISQRKCKTPIGVVCGRWITQNWGPCSKTCGTGFRIREYYCPTGLYCSSKLPHTNETCNNFPCPSTLKPTTKSTTTTIIQSSTSPLDNSSSETIIADLEIEENFINKIIENALDRTFYKKNITTSNNYSKNYELVYGNESFEMYLLPKTEVVEIFSQVKLENLKENINLINNTDLNSNMSEEYFIIADILLSRDTNHSFKIDSIRNLLSNPKQNDSFINNHLGLFTTPTPNIEIATDPIAIFNDNEIKHAKRTIYLDDANNGSIENSTEYRNDTFINDIIETKILNETTESSSELNIRDIVDEEDNENIFMTTIKYTTRRNRNKVHNPTFRLIYVLRKYDVIEYVNENKRNISDTTTQSPMFLNVTSTAIKTTILNSTKEASLEKYKTDSIEAHVIVEFNGTIDPILNILNSTKGPITSKSYNVTTQAKVHSLNETVDERFDEESLNNSIIIDINLDTSKDIFNNSTLKSTFPTESSTTAAFLVTSKLNEIVSEKITNQIKFDEEKFATANSVITDKITTNSDEVYSTETVDVSNKNFQGGSTKMYVTKQIGNINTTADISSKTQTENIDTTSILPQTTSTLLSTSSFETSTIIETSSSIINTTIEPSERKDETSSSSELQTENQTTLQLNTTQPIRNSTQGTTVDKTLPTTQIMTPNMNTSKRVEFNLESVTNNKATFDMVTTTKLNENFTSNFTVKYQSDSTVKTKKTTTKKSTTTNNQIINKPTTTNNQIINKPTTTNNQIEESEKDNKFDLKSLKMDDFSTVILKTTKFKTKATKPVSNPANESVLTTKSTTTSINTINVHNITNVNSIVKTNPMIISTTLVPGIQNTTDTIKDSNKNLNSTKLIVKTTTTKSITEVKKNSTKVTKPKNTKTTKENVEEIILTSTKTLPTSEDQDQTGSSEQNKSPTKQGKNTTKLKNTTTKANSLIEIKNTTTTPSIINSTISVINTTVQKIDMINSISPNLKTENTILTTNALLTNKSMQTSTKLKATKPTKITKTNTTTTTTTTTSTTTTTTSTISTTITTTTSIPAKKTTTKPKVTKPKTTTTTTLSSTSATTITLTSTSSTALTSFSSKSTKPSKTTKSKITTTKPTTTSTTIITDEPTTIAPSSSITIVTTSKQKSSKPTIPKPTTIKTTKNTTKFSTAKTKTTTTSTVITTTTATTTTTTTTTNSTSTTTPATTTTTSISTISKLLPKITKPTTTKKSTTKLSTNKTKKPSPVTKPLNQTIFTSITNVSDSSTTKNIKKRSIKDIDIIIWNADLIYEWEIGVFGPCSRFCGGGYKIRRVVCKSKINHRIVPDMHCLKKRPKTIEECNSEKCLDWKVDEWSECTENCGPGIQTRNVYCNVSGLCDPRTIPNTEQPCNLRPCIEWMMGEWSACSVSCGIGTKTRVVSCYNHVLKSVSTECIKKMMPASTAGCDTHYVCPTTTTTKAACVDTFKFSVCSKINLSNRCHNPYLFAKCCKTCTIPVHEIYDILKENEK